MKKLLALLAPLILIGSALAQPGPGPGPAPNPWVVNGATISYSNGGVLVGSTVTGGTKGAGTINAAGLYISGSSVLNQLAAGTYTGATSLTTLGTVTTGTWHASQIGVAYGGTGASSLTANAFLTGNGTSTINAVAITGLVKGNGSSAPTAYAGTSGSTHQFLTALSAAGAGTFAQPDFADISGSITSGQLSGSYTGITGVGTLTVGVWNATALTSAYLPATVVYYDANQSFTRAQRSTPSTLTISTATFTPNFDTGQNFNITLIHASCPCTLANPSTTPVAGQTGVIVVTQSATGSDTIGTWGSSYVAAGGTSTITLSSAANAVDYLSYYVKDSTHIVVSAGALNASH